MNEPREPERADASDEELAMADWVAELAERLEEGDPVDLIALERDHPERAQELERLLPAIRRMASLGRSIASSSAAGPSPGRWEPGGELGTLGDFRLLREVGRGGMGIVYEAEQVSLRRRVALKILPLAAALDPRHYQRFLLEARAAACLHHAHIVPVYAVGSERGVPYYCMQFIDGCTLADVLERLRGGDGESPTEKQSAGSASTIIVEPAAGAPPGPSTAAASLGSSSRDRRYVRAVAELGRRAAEALDHAHGRGVLHRDVKPANLMIDSEGHLWITDFGLAQVQGDGRLTLTGDVVGTLRYMSPEQALGKRVVIDGRADVYSLGATLYELLALRPVFDGSGRAEILHKIAQDEPAPLRRLNPAVPRDLETIVHKALAREPSDRYATARELADDLGRHLDARPIAARPPGRLARAGRWARRNRAVAIPAAIFLALAFLSSSLGLIWSNRWLSLHGQRLQIERDRAEALGGQLKAQRDLAEERRRVADHHLYAFRVRQAADALRAREYEKAQEILRDCRPGPGEEDPREFAWGHLWRESRKDVVVLSERTERVGSIALSPDGRTLATGNRDGTVRLRDPETGDVAKILRGGPDLKVDKVGFSPDGGRLVSGGLRLTPTVKSEVLVWEVDSGRLLGRLEGLSDRIVDRVAFDSLGEHVWELSYIPGAALRLGRWDVKSDLALPRLTWQTSFENARPPRPGDGPIGALDGPGDGFRIREIADAVRLGWAGSIDLRTGQVEAASADGRLLATGAGSWNVVWDLEADRERARYRNSLDEGLIWIGFSPDSRYFTVEFRPVDRCDVYDLRTGASWTIASAAVDVDPDRWRAHAFSPDGRLLARHVPTKGTPQPITIWQIEPLRKIVDSSDVLPGDAASLLFARDGRSLIVQTETVAVRWNYPTPQGSDQPDGHADEAWAAGFSTDGRLLATGGDDTDDPLTLKLWDATTGRLLRGWKAHEATTSALAFQPGGPAIASAGLRPDANLRLWDADGTLLATLEGHTDRVRTVAFSPDGHLLASAGSDRTIRVWDVAARRCVRTLTGHADVIRQVAFSPDGGVLASAGNDCTVRLWSAMTGEVVRTWEGAVKIAATAFSPDGGVLCWAQEDGVIQRWDLARGRPLPPLHSEYKQLHCLTFSHDGRTLAAAGRSGDVHLWDPVSGQELSALEGPPSQVNALAFSPDGSTLAACRHDGSVTLRSIPLARVGPERVGPGQPGGSRAASGLRPPRSLR